MRPQETPVQEQMEVLADQLLRKTPRGSEVMPFWKASNEYRSVFGVRIVVGEVSVTPFDIKTMIPRHKK